MELSKTKLAPVVKRVARNVMDIIRQRQKAERQLKDLEEKYAVLLKEKQDELDTLNRQQELFEAPVKEATGGYGIEELVIFETKQVTHSNGRVSNTVEIKLRYPETLIPVEAPAEEEEAPVCEEKETAEERPFEEQGTAEEKPFEYEYEEDLPFKD